MLAVTYLDPTPADPRGIVAVLAAMAAAYLGSRILRTRYKRRVIQETVQHEGVVCQAIPANQQGGAQQRAGKVRLIVRNRTLEFPAVSSQLIPAGKSVVVVGVVGPDTVEVTLA